MKLALSVASVNVTLTYVRCDQFVSGLLRSFNEIMAGYALIGHLIFLGQVTTVVSFVIERER